MSVATGLRSEARAALGDYRFLVERGYPDRPSIELVGNRYRLTREERNLLFRGVVAEKHAAGRCAKLVTVLQLRERDRRGQRLSLRVDGYNVLYTILAYLRGAGVFICTDCVLRDVSAAHGRRPPAGKLRSAVGLLCEALGALPAHRAILLLDAQVRLYYDPAELLRDALAGRGVQAEIRTTAQADAELTRAPGDTVVATSDSVILDRTAAAVFDLARYALERAFSPVFLDLRREETRPECS